MGAGTWFVEQTTPQAPQFFSSVRVPTSQPLASDPSQLPNPAVQVMPHAPAVQVATPFVPTHAVPHVPQLTLPPQPSAIVPQRKPAGQAVIGVHGAGRESEVLDVRVNPAGVVGLPGVYVTLVELEGVRSDGVGLSDVTNVSGSHGFGALGPVMSAVDVDAIV